MAVKADRAIIENAFNKYQKDRKDECFKFWSNK